MFSQVLVVFFTAIISAHAADQSCYDILTKLQWSRFARTQLGDKTPVILLANGTEVPIARAFEKEGLLYSDIATWFPSAKLETKDHLKARLEAELTGKKSPRNLLRWLKNYSTKYRSENITLPKSDWLKLDPRAQLEFVISGDDFFKNISIQGREDLFYDGILKFDDLTITSETPARLTVGDDLGSYEVRSNGGTTDRTRYMEDRDIVEHLLESKVGHQHKVHAWPKDPTQRELMSKKYIELLDSTSWYLFWRQMKRNPADIESILAHPYLGVYTRTSLVKLYDAVMSNDPAKFKNKYRTVGARNFKADPNIPEQLTSGPIVPDWELRSGNKGENRDFVEDMVEARIASGDYSGLKNFDDYEFNPHAPIEALTYKHLNRSEIEDLKKFEEIFPLMRYSARTNAHNHVRTKIISPLLEWGTRLGLRYKKDEIEHQQKLYAKRLAAAAHAYVTKIEGLKGREKISELRAETLSRLERSIYTFSSRVRLDLDLERYIQPQPTTLPNILVKNDGPLDVNDISLGIEYSFRFPTEAPITSRDQAQREILRAVDLIRAQLGGGKIERLDDGGHGHGASVRYRLIDPQGRIWRAEWDGIQREYIEGKLINPHGGHMEVPSPKFKPRDARFDIAPIFRAARENGQFPKRAAGGGHMNVDLGPLKELPTEQGVQKVKNMIALYESIREMMTFLWQHPHRLHAARPVEYSETFAQDLANFHGDWDDFAVFLYSQRYFNPYVTRKPRYVEMDVTGLMGPAVPLEYKKGTLDIKNPESVWFPDFGTGKDRSEFRLYDAPVNELFAALQIKYHRAFLNRAFNSSEPILLKPLYERGSKEKWRHNAALFVAAAEEHYRMLGLDPEEFKPLTEQAWQMQQEDPSPPKVLEMYKTFLPPVDPKKEREKTGASFWITKTEFRLSA